MTDNARSDLLQGTLEMMLLKLLSTESNHGWGLSFRLRQITRLVFDVNQGSIYPALQRLLRRGLIRSEWRPSENNRRARYYEITEAGRHALGSFVADWVRSSNAVNRVLRHA